MKLILKPKPGLPETEVEVRYSEFDVSVQNLVSRIKQSEQYLYGENSGRQYRILIDDILYAESVDRRTFIYTKSEVFCSELKLYQLLERLKSSDFVQVSKACALNINALETIQTLFNSRLEGTLVSGEKITISRTYLPSIKAAFSQKGGN